MATPFKPELVICSPTEPDSLIGSASPLAAPIAALVAGRAVDYGDDYTARAGLLRALPNESDGTLRRNDDGTLSVILQYRDDLKWSDGQPFVTADAILGFKTAPPPGEPIADILNAVEGDGLTVKLTLAEGAEYPYVPPQPPLPSHALTDFDPTQLSSNPYARMVNPALGPYFVSEWSPGDHILLNANPYYSPQPRIPVVRVGFIGDPNQLLDGLSGTTCDVALDGLLTVDQRAALDQAAASGAIHAFEWPGTVRDEIVLNTFPGSVGRVPYFADPGVRQAVAYGFDRAAAVKQLSDGLSAPLDGWIPDAHWAAGGGGFSAYSLDPTRAASLLDQAGWRDEDGDGIREYHGAGGDLTCQRGKWSIRDKTPLTPTLILPDGDARRSAIAMQLQTELRAIGMGLSLQAVKPETLFSSSGPVQHRDFDLALISQSIGPDPAGISQWVGSDVFRHPLDKSVVHRWQLEQRWLDTEQLVERLALNNIPRLDNDWQGQNYAGWCNEPADVAVVQANLSFDLGQRKGFYAQQEAQLTADVPVIPLAYRTRLAASKSYVCGLQPGPVDPLTWNVAMWWFDPTGACAG